MNLEIFSLETLEPFIHEYGYWSVFVGIGLENMGIPLPGEALTLIGGFLAGSGELSYRWVLLGAIAGSFIGNTLGYFIGKWGGLPLLRKITHFFRLDEAKLDEAREKFLENAPKAVFFGRFITFFRIFAAPLAGIVEMSFPLFLACNLAGAIVWASVTVTLPFFLGQALPLDEVIKIMAKFGAGIVIVIGVLLAIKPMINQLKLKNSAE